MNSLFEIPHPDKKELNIGKIQTFEVNFLYQEKKMNLFEPDDILELLGMFNE